MLLSEAATGVVLKNKSVPKNFTKFTRKHLRRSLFFNKVPGPRTATSLKKRFRHSCFLLNFAKFLRTFFYRANMGDCFCVVLGLLYIREVRREKRITLIFNLNNVILSLVSIYFSMRNYYIIFFL